MRKQPDCEALGSLFPPVTFGIYLLPLVRLDLSPQLLLETGVLRDPLRLLIQAKVGTDVP